MKRSKRKPWSQLALSATPANDAQRVDLGNDNGLAEFMEGAQLVGPRTAPTEAENRARGGRRAQRCGKEHELRVAGLLASAKELEILRHWNKVEIETERVRVETVRGFEWFLKPAGDAHADFAAVLNDAARRSIAVECKSIEGARLYKDAILPQQVEHLDAVAIGILAAEWRDEGRVMRDARWYAIPWAEVPWEVASSAESIAEAAVARWRVVLGSDFFRRLEGR